MSDFIEQDDEKFDELMSLQMLSDMSKPAKYSSLEEKYEVEIAIDEFVKSLDKQYGEQSGSEEPNENWVEEDDEQ